MMKWLKRLFNGAVEGMIDGAHVRARMFDDVVPVVDDTQLQYLLDRFNNEHLWNIKHLATSLKAWRRISPVKVTTKFGGWGYVEGRTEAFEVDDRLHVFEYDDCMDFTSLMVLIDGAPCLDITRKRGNTLVTVITGRDYFEEFLDPSGKPINTAEQLKRLPDPMQRPVLQLLGRVKQYEDRRVDAVEKLLSYKETT